MIDKHLSEEELQQYALDADQPQPFRSHIQECAACRTRLEIYQLLFSEIREAAKPEFNFDVAASVMAKLPAPIATEPEKFPVYLTVSLTAVFILAVVWAFRGYLSELFSGSHVMIQVSIAAVVSTILVLHALDVVKRYKKKMQALNFI